MTKKILTLLIIVVAFSSCRNFLDVTPKNVISMQDMPNIKRTMGGFLYNVVVQNGGGVTGSILPWSPFSPGRFSSMSSASDEWDLRRIVEKDGATQSDILSVSWSSTSTSSLWSGNYEIIGFMNNLLNEANNQQERGEMYDYVTGEAHFFRAFSFFKLIQYFSPYNDNRLGIPICLNTFDAYKDQILTRQTQQAAYKQILEDLHAVEERLERTNPREGYSVTFNRSVLNRMFARVYLFKAGSASKESTDWANVAKYAGIENEGVTLCNDSVKLKNFFNLDVKNGLSILEGIESPIRVVGDNGATLGGYLNEGSKLPSSEYLNMYEHYDIRRKLYWNEALSIKNPITGLYETTAGIRKYTKTNSWLSAEFRQAESFLMEAEALAYSNPAAAAAVLLRFKQARYTIPVTVPSTKDEILKEVYRERQKEFLVESDFRWIDMKRLGVKVTREIGDAKYTLEPDDYRYTFRIPDSEIDNSIYVIENNPGWGAEQ